MSKVKLYDYNFWLAWLFTIISLVLLLSAYFIMTKDHNMLIDFSIWIPGVMALICAKIFRNRSVRHAEEIFREIERDR